MVSEIDIYRTAKQVIDNANGKKHPKELTICRMCELYDKGDIEGAETWARIGNAVDELLKDNHDGVFH